jgi:hypothetical protein
MIPDFENFNAMNIPILVVSCDAYQDVWHPFFDLFFKHWPDCPLPVHLVSNDQPYRGDHTDRVQSILVGEDVDYSSNLIKAVEQLEQEWLIFWVDDRPPAEPVDTDRLLGLIALAQSKNAGYFRLLASNPPTLEPTSDDMGELPKGSRYRVSMTVALWKKSTLLKILKAGENAWDIEKRGGVDRSNTIDDAFYAMPLSARRRPPLKDIHLIAKGKVIRSAIPTLEKAGTLHYLKARSVVSLPRNLRIELYPIVWNLYYQVLGQFKRVGLIK